MLSDSSNIIVRIPLIKVSVKRGCRCQVIHTSFLKGRVLLKMVCANILSVECLPLKTAIMCFHGSRKDHSGN